MVGHFAVTILFADAFETGDYTGWVSTVVSGTGTTLTANAGSAYAGSFGSDALVTGGGGNEASCKSGSKVPSTNVRSAQCRFKVHQHNASTGQVYRLQLQNGGDTQRTNLENHRGTWSIVLTASAA